MKLKRKLLLFCIPLFGVLLTAYSPMASFSNAQIVINLLDLQKGATTELDSRISSYEATLGNMKDVPISANGGAGSFSTDGKGSSASTITCVDPKSNSSSPGLTAVGIGFSIPVGLPCGTQDKAKQNLQTTVDGLKDMKNKVANTKSPAEMQALAKNIDAQYGLNKAAQAQAGMVQSIASMTGVLDKLKTTYSDVESRINALKECLEVSSSPSPSPSTSASPSVSASPKLITNPEVQCEGVSKFVTQAYINQSQATLDSLSIIISSMTSTLNSTIALYNTLADSYEKTLSSLGNKGSLGNLANLSSMTSSGGLSALQGTAGSMNGQLGALGGMSSQLGTTQGMATGATNDMVSLGSGVMLIPLTF